MCYGWNPHALLVGEQVVHTPWETESLQRPNASTHPAESARTSDTRILTRGSLLCGGTFCPRAVLNWGATLPLRGH